MVENFIATIKNDNGEIYEYGLIVEEQSAIYSGELSVIITKDDLADPTIVINGKELSTGPLDAESVDGVKELAAAFIGRKHNQDVHWKNEQF
jgi:hypothetical protein